MPFRPPLPPIEPSAGDKLTEIIHGLRAQLTQVEKLAARDLADMEAKLALAQGERAHLKRAIDWSGAAESKSILAAAFAFADAWRNADQSRQIIESADNLTEAVRKMRAETESKEATQ